MKKFLEIAKIQITSMLGDVIHKGSRKSKGIGLVLLIMVSLIYASSVYSFSIYSVLPTDSKDTVLYIMAAATLLLIFVFSITTAQGQLFQFKDFERLMSWPISRSQVFLAKIISFVGFLLAYTVLFFIPTLFIFGYHEKMGLMYYVFGIVGTLFLPLIPIALSSLIAFFIRKIAGNGRYKNLFVNLGSILMFAGIMFVSFSINSISESLINPQTIDRVKSFIQVGLYPVYAFVHACLTTNLVEFLIAMIIPSMIFSLFIFVFSKTFIQINSQVQSGFKVKNFKLKSEKGKTSFLALYQKEFSKFTSNMMYFMNMGIGQVMLVLGGLYLVFNKANVLAILASAESAGLAIKPMIYGLVCIAIFLFALMSPTASVSISLEGKHLWITKTSPVKTEIVFLSKALVNASIIWIPSLFGFILMSVAFEFTLIEILIGIVYIVIVGIFVGLLGLVININFPKIEFDREILVIKQSASSFISIMGGMILGIITMFIFINVYHLIGTMNFILILVVFLCSSVVLFWNYLRKTGVKKFYELY